MVAGARGIEDMDEYNEQYYWLESGPYRAGISLAFLSGIAATALVFKADVAAWFGVSIVGEEKPQDPQLEERTTNQVGMWTWNWMEPLIGTASFVLLCCQFGRAQLIKMNMTTWGDAVMQQRALRLSKAYPRYNGAIVEAWAQYMPKVKPNMFPEYERTTGFKGFTSNL